MLTLLLPLSETLGEKSVSPSPMMLPRIISGMMIAMIIKLGAHPCLGADPAEPDEPGEGCGWCSGSVGDEIGGR